MFSGRINENWIQPTWPLLKVTLSTRYIYNIIYIYICIYVYIYMYSHDFPLKSRIDKPFLRVPNLRQEFIASPFARHPAGRESLGSPGSPWGVRRWTAKLGLGSRDFWWFSHETGDFPMKLEIFPWKWRFSWKSTVNGENIFDGGIWWKFIFVGSGEKLYLWDLVNIL